MGVQSGHGVKTKRGERLGMPAAREMPLNCGLRVTSGLPSGVGRQRKRGTTYGPKKKGKGGARGKMVGRGAWH